MNWLVLAFVLEAGLMPVAEIWNVEPPANAREDRGRYTLLDAEVEVAQYLFVGGHVTTYMWAQDDSWTQSPLRADYGFRAGVRFRGLELGWKHFCSHPVAPNWNLIRELPYEASYDQIYIRVSGRAVLWGDE